MMSRLLVFLLLLGVASGLLGQGSGDGIEGKVSFVTSKNVYVSFLDTNPIEVGDTLFMSEGRKACLRVENKSSRSCVCVPIGDCVLKKGDPLSFYPEKKSKPVPATETEILPEPEETEAPRTLPATEEAPPSRERIRGRVTISSYQTVSSTRSNRSRYMGRLWLDARNINDSRFSVYAQANYRHIVPETGAKFSPQTRYLNVYNLALQYDLDSSLSFTLGRRINPSMASIGAIDGLQVKKTFGQIQIGGIVGFRPDITGYGFNPNLLEYGVYLGHETHSKHFRSQSTAGVIEQRNAGQIDRRYAYLQHSSRVGRNFTLFSSLELDLYQSVNGVVSSSLRLPNLYISGSYRFGRIADLSLSFDSRKRVLFFETFQTEIERLLDDDLARQGIRARLNVRPVKQLRASVSYGRRYQSDQQNKSDNVQANLSYSHLPVIDGRISLSYNFNQSNYLTSNIFSARYSRDFLDNKLDTDLYYRQARFIYINSEMPRVQHYVGTNLAYNLNRKWGIRLTAERTDFNNETLYRGYVSLIRRF